MAESTAYGHSLRVVNGDLVFDNGRLAEISGRENLQQALVLRVLTPFSSDTFNTTYGLDIQSAFTEPNTLGLTKQIIKLNLVRTLATDTRVRDITDILFEDDQEYQARHPLIGPTEVADDRHRRVWRVDVLFDTIDNQAQSLSANLRL